MTNNITLNREARIREYKQRRDIERLGGHTAAEYNKLLRERNYLMEARDMQLHRACAASLQSGEQLALIGDDYIYSQLKEMLLQEAERRIRCRKYEMSSSPVPSIKYEATLDFAEEV